MKSSSFSNHISYGWLPSYPGHFLNSSTLGVRANFLFLSDYWKNDGLLDQSALLNRTALKPIVNNSYEAD